MALWKPVPLAGGAYSDDSKAWSVQDCVNLIPIAAERPGARSEALLRGVPGLVDFATVGTGPIRGVRNVEGRLLVVSGSRLYQVDANGASSELGAVPGVSRVSMAHNQISLGNEVTIAATGGGYLYNTATGAFGPITDEGFPGAKTFDFIDGFTAFCEPFGRFWGHSNLAAAGDYNTNDRYESETAPDRITTILVSHREVLAFNERTIDVFVNTGAATNTFARANGVSIDIGCIAKDTPQRLDNSVVWLGNDGTVYRLNGYTPERISTGPIEQAISRVNQAQAFAMTFEDRGHKVYYLTFPDGQTWGWDAATNEWHRRQSYGFNRWRINTLTYWNKQWIAGDFSTGKLYRMAWSVQTEAGQPLVRERTGGVLHNNQNRLFVKGLELVLGGGGTDVVPPEPPPPTSYIALAVHDFGSRPASLYQVSDGALAAAATNDGPTFPSGVAMTADASLVAFGTAFNNDAVLLKLYQRSGTTLSAYGTFVPPLSGTPNDTGRVALASDGSYLAVTSLTDKIDVYKRSGATFTRLAQPATLPDTINPTNGNVYSAAFSPGENHLVVTRRTLGVSADGIFIYARAGDTFTLVSSEPDIAPTGKNGINVAFSPTGDLMVTTSFTTTSTGYVQIYTVAGNVFTQVGTITVAASKMPVTPVFSHDGAYLAISCFFGGVRLFKRNGNAFDELTSPLPPGGSVVSSGVVFSADDAYLVLSMGDDTLRLISRVGDTFTLAQTVIVGAIGPLAMGSA